MAQGVRYGGERKKKPVDVDLVSPTGARITVTEERAKVLLGRAPIDMPDGKSLGYRLADEVDEDDEPVRRPSSGRQERQTVNTGEGGDK